LLIFIPFFFPVPVTKNEELPSVIKKKKYVFLLLQEPNSTIEQL